MSHTKFALLGATLAAACYSEGRSGRKAVWIGSQNLRRYFDETGGCRTSHHRRSTALGCR